MIDPIQIDDAIRESYPEDEIKLQSNWLRAMLACGSGMISAHFLLDGNMVRVDFRYHDEEIGTVVDTTLANASDAAGWFLVGFAAHIRWVEKHDDIHGVMNDT